MNFAGRLPRQLHPLAWWLWALGLATAASRTSNPLLLALMLAVLGVVVASRRSEAPWARAFKYYLWMALLVIVIRIVFRSLFGGDVAGGGTHTLVRLPQLPLPHWAAGIQVGGPVTLEGTLSAVYGGLQLATLLCCLGAANALANGKRALRVLPGALHELSVAVVVAFTLGPQLVESVQRVRRVRRLRGDSTSGSRRHALKTIAIPVLEDALERSMRLAAAMDSRGYGRIASAVSKRAAGRLMLLGLLGLSAGVFGLLDSSAPGWLRFPTLLAGAGLCCGGLVLGGRRVHHSSYRPDPWGWPEWAVVASGLLPAAVLISSAGAAPGSLAPSTAPLVWPGLPLWPACAVLAGLAAAALAPPPARSRRPSLPARPPAEVPARQPVGAVR